MLIWLAQLFLANQTFDLFQWVKKYYNCCKCQKSVVGKLCTLNMDKFQHTSKNYGGNTGRLLLVGLNLDIEMFAFAISRWDNNLL